MSRLAISPRRLGALLRKELYGFFAQPLFYAVGAVFLLLAGYYFYSDLVFFVTFGFGENIFENFFQLLFVDLRLVLLLTVPLLTMRLFAEEKKLGTIELLLTYPLSDAEIFFAKLIASGLAALALLAATLPALWFLHGLTPFPLGPVLAAYAGLGLMALSFATVGLLLSSLTDSQVVAAMSTLGTLLLLWVLSWHSPSSEGGLAGFVARLSMFDHFESFSRGVVETKDLAYFLCLVVIAAAAALQAIGARGWRGGELVPTVVGLVGLLVALGFADALADRHNVRLDLTPQRRYTLSPHARRILERLPADVELVAFVRSGDPANAGTADLLTRIAAASPRVHTRIVDVNRNPALARRYGVDAYGAIVVETQGRQHLLGHADEAALVGAMLELGRGGSRVIGFVTGHGEARPDNQNRQNGLSDLGAALADEGYAVAVVDLERPIATDVAVLVVAGGTRPWSAEQLAALGAWMDRGGRLLALVEPTAPPELSRWLAGRGMAPQPVVVLDPENRLYGGEGVSIEASPVPANDDAKRSEGGSARIVTDSLDHGVLLSLACSLELAPEVLPLLRSSAQSWATPDFDRAERGFASFEPGRDLRGPFPVAGAREWLAEQGAAARAIVVGDVDFASNGFIEFLSNRDMVLNAIGWLAGDEDLIALRPRRKEMGRQQLFLSAAQARAALVLAVGVLPGASAAIGAALWLRRRLGQ